MAYEATTKEPPLTDRQDGAASSARTRKVKFDLPSVTDLAKGFVKRALSRVVDYHINWIVAQQAEFQLPDLPALIEVCAFGKQHHDTFAHHPDARVRSALSFERAGCIGFVLLANAKPAAFLHFADVSKYENASIWPLADNEAALVNVITLPEHRSRHYASLLIAHATASLVPSSYQRAIAYVWWNHGASLRAFKKAGWRRIGISVEISRRNGRLYSIHIPLRAGCYAKGSWAVWY